MSPLRAATGRNPSRYCLGPLLIHLLAATAAGLRRDGGVPLPEGQWGFPLAGGALGRRAHGVPGRRPRDSWQRQLWASAPRSLAGGHGGGVCSVAKSFGRSGCRGAVRSG
jgi:hypothetical protein